MRRIAGALSSHLHVFAIITLLLPRLARGASCGQTHTVASGEGCWSIYTDAKLTQAQFLGINPGLDCNVLAVGQQVCVAPACSKFYTVQSGDYCYKIESEQGISEADFMALNPGLACGEIFAGQRVCVAAPAASPTSTISAGPSTTSTAPSTTSAGSVTTSPTTVPSPTIVACGRSRAVSQGDTCYDLASANGLQLSQFVALNDGLNCSALQAGDVACIGILCGQIYKVQGGDWCAKIESDWSLAPNQLTTLNPGLSCNDLAPQQNVCVEPAIIDNSVNNATIPAPDPYPALSPGGTVPQSPLLSFAAAEGNARSTFYGEVIFQSDYQHLTAFAHNDLNSDGKLDHDELQKMMSHDPKIVRGIGEINSTLTANNLVSEMLKTADRNGDGSIDRDEFLYAIRQVQNATNVVSELAADNTALGQQRKRIIPLVIAGIAAIIGLVIADVTLFFQLLARNELFRGNDLLSYLDITYWDGSGSPPSCSAYLYWSTNCGAIGSGHAKSCSKGGKRVFDNSCVTHFHSGSAGCGFLGCKSLCYDFNLENCDCDALKYKAERETEYTDTPASSTDETGVGACRKKCGGMNGCVGFSVSPGKSDTTLTCKVFKALSNKKSNSGYTTFRLVGSPVGSGGNTQCAPVEGTEFTHWPASVMADDIAFGEKLSDAYGSSSLRKRAPSSVDRRNNALYKTTIKNQNVISCGLCAPFSFTTTVEGTHKVWKKGYSDARDLSPVWVGRCKGGQSCDKGKQGGLQSRLLNAVGHNYIYSESCVPLSTVLKPDCSVSCGGRTLPYITGHKEWNFQHQEAPTVRRYIEEVKEWIANTGPVMANMCYNDAFTDYLSTLSTNSQDKVFWDNDPQWKSKACGTCNHAIVIVGYFEHKRPNTSKTRVVWIIQNSYGAFSGKGGYQFIEHGSAAMAAKPWFGVKVNEGRIHDET